MKTDTLHKAKLWMKPPFDKKTQKLVKQLINSNTIEIEDAFKEDLKFGTGGIRGIIGVGTNRLNRYTLGKTIQGFSNYLKKIFLEKITVAIAYDVRNNSKEFSKIVANIFTANGIYVYTFESFRTTPELSFAIRYLKCQAGVMLTASHNPPKYNGYKIYFNDGAQVVPPHEIAITKHINELNFNNINFNGNKKLITIIGEKIDKQFINCSLQFGSYNNDANSNLEIVFTPIHGTTINIIPKILKQAGFNKLHIVKEQSMPNGNFPTVKSPNPEEKETLSIAIEKGNNINADLVIGTDPDGDRLGIATRNKYGNFELLTGNETNIILTNYLLNIWNKKGKIKGQEFIGSTIVSSDIFFDLAKLYGVECKVGLTGFKWIAKMIHDTEGKKKFICGGEESFGFMVEDFIRDKDSITSTLLICEIAAQSKKQNKTLFDILAEVYMKTGFYLDELISITKEGRYGLKEIKSLMNHYRNTPQKYFSGSEVVRLDDYYTSISKNLITGKIKKINIPKSNVLIFYTKNGTKIACRPSGTEPKIKYYFSVKSNLTSIKDYEQVKNQLKKEIKELKKNFFLENNVF